MKVAGNLEAGISGTGSGPSVRAVSILPLPDGKRKYYCGTSLGLYSADTLLMHVNNQQPGTQWMLEAPDVIGRVVVEAVETRASDGLVIVGTHANGLYSSNILPVTGNKEPQNTIQVQCRPNPVRDVATVQITGVQAGGAIWRLFDLQGKLLLQNTLQGNNGQINMQALPPGIYVYDIRGKGWKRSGKLVKT